MSEQDDYREAQRYAEWQQEQEAYEQAQYDDELSKEPTDIQWLIEKLRERASGKGDVPPTAILLEAAAKQLEPLAAAPPDEEVERLRGECAEWRKSDRQSLIVRLKQGLYDGSDIMRAWCMLRQDGERITELEQEVERLRKELTEANRSRERLRERLDKAYREAEIQTSLRLTAEARLNRLLERLEKHHHADTCFSRLVPPPDNTCDCWKSEIAEARGEGDE